MHSQLQCVTRPPSRLAELPTRTHLVVVLQQLPKHISSSRQHCHLLSFCAAFWYGQSKQLLQKAVPKCTAHATTWEHIEPKRVDQNPH
jgi:hypothetical protein